MKSHEIFGLMLAGSLLFAGVAAAGQAEEGLVLHYAFDEGAGHSFLLDKSGNGHDGKIVGNAEWAEEKNRSVLRFDGKTYVDAGTSLNAIMGERGTLETWCFPEKIEGGLIGWNTPHAAGADHYLDQRLMLSFYTYQDSRLIGILSDGVNTPYSTRFLHTVETGKWSHLVMTFDGTNIQLFVNGELAETIYQEELAPKLAEAPLCIGRVASGLNQGNFVGRMAEVRVYNRALSAEEAGRHFATGVKGLGIDIPPSLGMTTRLDAKQGELTALCGLARISNLPARPGVYAALLASARLDESAKRAELALGEASLKAGPPAKPGRDTNKKVLQEKTVPVPPNGGIVPVVFSIASLTAGLYEVSVVVKDMEANKTLGEPTTVRWYLPEVGQLAGAPPGSPSVAGAAAKEGRKILNNLVTQLAAVDNLPLKDYQEVPFVNPRKGWVFVSATVTSQLRGGKTCSAPLRGAAAAHPFDCAQDRRAALQQDTPYETEALPAAAQAGNRGLITLGVDNEKKEAAIVSLATNNPTAETMRLLSAGEHKLCIWTDSTASGKPAAISRLVIRAVPAMMYCGWPGSSAIDGYGEYGFKFLARDVLPNITTLSGGATGGAQWDPDRAEWKRRGRQLLQEQGIPTRLRDVLKDVPNPITGDYVYNYWTNSPGFTNPYYDGMIEDEFSGGEDPNFLGYIEAVKRIAANPAFKDKVVHMWGGPNMARSALSRDFVQAVIDSGYKLAWEDYLHEVPTVEEAKALFDKYIRGDMEEWEQAFPGFPRHAIWYLGLQSAPPMSLNINPGVDYKVFLDMQFQHLAVSPECFGLWGVGFWKAIYAEEEALRWVGRLFRHYCIEGNTNLLSEQYGFTYNPRHIRNPDFDEGLKGWRVAAAEPGSVKTGHMRDLHLKLGRYHGSWEGNNFLLMKRSGKKPNRVSQDITGLQAGRCYSMKMYVVDHQDLLQVKSEKKRLAVAVMIENVEMIPAKSFVSDVLGCYPWGGKTMPYLNYHRHVFRAKGPTARLTLSDWAAESTPGGPAGLPSVAGAAAKEGQETLVNFIEIQPYLED